MNTICPLLFVGILLSGPVLPCRTVIGRLV